LGDGGIRAILEFVGVRDRVVERSQKPAFDDAEDTGDVEETGDTSAVEQEVAANDAETAEDSQEKDAK
jgi:hypothetical protein